MALSLGEAVVAITDRRVDGRERQTVGSSGTVKPPGRR